MDINFNLLYDLSMRYAYDVLRALNRIAESDSDKLILSDWEENLSRVVKKPYYYSSNYNKEKLMPYLGAYFVDQKARDSLYEFIRCRR